MQRAKVDTVGTMWICTLVSENNRITFVYEHQMNKASAKMYNPRPIKTNRVVL
jgi:hypothetical protein